MVGLVNDLSSFAQDYIKVSDDHHDDNSEVPDTPQLLALTRAEGYFLIGFAFVVIFYEAVVIVLRCCNCSLWIRLFLIVVRKGILDNSSDCSQHLGSFYVYSRCFLFVCLFFFFFLVFFFERKVLRYKNSKKKT